MEQMFLAALPGMTKGTQAYEAGNGHAGFVILLFCTEQIRKIRHARHGRISRPVPHVSLPE